MKAFIKFALIAAIALPVLPACAITTDKDQTVEEYEGRKGEKRRVRRLEGGDERIFGELSIGGNSKEKEEGGNVAAVNLFLWRASLETLSLGPLESADPFGGVIITDWFTLAEDPGNEYRVIAYILGRSLRTDNIKVALYVRSGENGQRMARRASPEAETRLENVILTKARTIRATQYR